MYAPFDLRFVAIEKRIPPLPSFLFFELFFRQSTAKLSLHFAPATALSFLSIILEGELALFLPLLCKPHPINL